MLTPPRRAWNPLVPSLSDRVAGKYAVITGASSGIGRELAVRLAAAGAVTIVVARREAELDRLVHEIENDGGAAHYVAADLSEEAGVNAVADTVLDRFGAPDLLVNNAGRSIMRPMAAAERRLHDYERTMRLNYLAGVGLMLRFLPGMRARGSGHIVHSSSVGVLTNLPEFSAYVGSKAALDAVMRIAEVESAADGITFTNVHLPLVATNMVSGDFEGYTRLSVDQAVDMMTDAIRRRPRSVDNPLGRAYSATRALAPAVAVRAASTAYRAR
ncbi:MAG: SDR family NAD(P)-dependent oxidoreductase [Nocardia sp.]|nr:SDR family NAD(P)-dependent oxidoreductase [Nocardia sp.]